MNKKKKNEIISIIVVLLICIIVYIFFMNRNIHTLNIPKVDDLSSISFERGSVMKKITDEKVMEDIVLQLNGSGRMTKKESVNDAPVEIEQPIKVELHLKKEGSSIVYLYEKSDKYYLEQAYNGIYEISGDEYKSLEKYLQ